MLKPAKPATQNMLEDVPVDEKKHADALKGWPKK